jgi:hypothetical protein
MFDRDGPERVLCCNVDIDIDITPVCSSYRPARCRTYAGIFVMAALFKEVLHSSR